ncbi:hypothetical protein [Noviherbaspirillum massiliense]|uniref:hypothetical protein n=1 Tax=Noviherbaspirillum massiliense TaxID=1465823 RepID=UPI0002EAFF7E|nr:hypothetical protein [Noviherbaspirillum massiliense]
MKKTGLAFLVFLSLGLLASSSAWAHRVHSHVGFYVGVPTGYWAYPPPAYYVYPPAVTVQSTPPVYVEQSPGPQANEPEPGNWWYYCQDAKGYYPYVKECPRGWQKVVPAPPDAR